MAAHERAVVDTFVELAGSLTHDYEISEFLTTLVARCAEVLDVTAGGVMLENPEGHLQLAVALSSEMEVLEQAEIDNEDGPCHEAYRTGAPVVADDLDDPTVAERWPTVVERMRAMGLRAVYAFPLRLADQRIGALNLYRTTPGAFDDDDIRVAQALADVATIGILQERRASDAEARSVHLRHALDSRVAIEQAKGIVSAQRGISVSAAFDEIRLHARTNHRRLRDVVEAVIEHGSSAIEVDQAER